MRRQLRRRHHRNAVVVEEVIEAVGPIDSDGAAALRVEDGFGEDDRAAVFGDVGRGYALAFAEAGAAEGGDAAVGVAVFAREGGGGGGEGRG